jgi:hypothetical protein
LAAPTQYFEQAVCGSSIGDTTEDLVAPTEQIEHPAAALAHDLNCSAQSVKFFTRHARKYLSRQFRTVVVRSAARPLQ